MIKLAERKAAEIQSAKSIRDKATAENRDMTADELANIKTHLANADALKQQIEASDNIDAEVNDLSVSRGRRVPGETAITSELKERVSNDPKRGFLTMGEFAQSVAEIHTPGLKIKGDERLRVLATATGDSQAIGSEGGFLVPPSFSTQIWDGMNMAPDNLIGKTDNYTVEGESLTFPANAETSRLTGSRYGGVQGYWISEAQQITNSKPKFRQVKLEPFQLAVLIYCTDKLLRNSPVALDQYVTRAATDEINFLIGDAIINGDGTGKPKGILSGTAGNVGVCRVSITKETGQAGKTIVKENIDKMYARMHPKSLPRAEWYANIDCLPQLQQLSQVVGVGGIPVYLPPGGIGSNLTEAPNGRLYGKPINFIEYAATCGTEGDLIFADMKSYATGTMGGINSAMSMHLRFDFAETAFRFMFAADGQPWLASAITPYKGANTLSPFVTIAARA